MSQWSDGLGVRAARVRPVLVGVDGREGTADVLRSAGELARRLGLPLVVGHVRQLLPAGVAPGAEVLTRVCIDTELELLLMAAEALDPVGVVWSLEMDQGDPVQGFQRLADRCDASILVIGTQRPGRRAALRRLVSGSFPAQLLRSETRPVLVVPRQTGERAAVRRTVSRVKGPK